MRFLAAFFWAALGPLCGGDDGAAAALGGVLVVVFEEDGSEGAAHVPLDVVGEHAEEDVGAHPVLAPVVDGSEEFDGLEAAEGALDAGEVLVGADGLRGVEAFGFDIGADDVDACEGGFGADHVLVALEGEGGCR